MKKSIVMLAAFTFLAVGSFAQKEKKHHHKKVAAAKEATMYHCSMKCLDDKQYASEGKCEKCGMKLVAVKK
jgi:transcription initiation factor IIE alpha subunit